MSHGVLQPAIKTLFTVRDFKFSERCWWISNCPSNTVYF